MAEAQSFDQTIFHSQLQEDQEVGPDGNKLLRIPRCVEFAVCSIAYNVYRIDGNVESRQFRKCTLPVVLTTESVS
jgi:hypothetical protein